MSVAAFIPTVWTAALLSPLEKLLVYGSPMVCNRDYQGEISQQGDSVVIGMVSGATVKDYTRNADIADPEQLDADKVILLIDNAKYWNFAVDDVDALQATPELLIPATRRTAYSLRDAIDIQLEAAMVAGTSADNVLGSSGSPKTFASTTATLLYEYIVDLGVELDEANCPAEERWVIIPPWYHGYLLKDARFVSYGTDANRLTLENGRVGRAAGFEILVSNNVSIPTGTVYAVMAGATNQGLSFAQQLLETTAYRPEKRFSDAVKGLMVYGYKVIRPEMLACLYINRTPTG